MGILDNLEDFSAPDDSNWQPGPMCSRCLDEVELFEANCAEKPEDLRNLPLGMYHCPDCGAMVVAGVPHGLLCKRCIDRKHPGFDRID